MSRRELLMKAKVLNPEKHEVGGWFMSEKLDGIRCFWDGGITRGTPTVNIPWAGIINPKTGQPKTRIKEFSTGLWSQYGNPIIAPDWFLNTLPCAPLDGELWAGRGNFQKAMSAVRKNKPVDEEWKQIQYGIFGSPAFETFCEDGEIKNANQLTDIRDAAKFIIELKNGFSLDWKSLSEGPSFTGELLHLDEWVDNFNGVTFLIVQHKLPIDNETAMEIVKKEKERIIIEGGEGLFLRDPKSKWTPKRVWTSLKYKGALDAEGTVVGFTAGRKTEKGSKHLGKIGALILDYNGHRLELSGLTDQEREFETGYESRIAEGSPGRDMPPSANGKMFKNGDQVTFTYRELTDAGVPKEARYMRPRRE